MVSLIPITSQMTLMCRLQYQDVRPLLTTTDFRMMKGLRTVLGKCKQDGFDPDAFVIWPGASDARRKA